MDFLQQKMIDDFERKIHLLLQQNDDLAQRNTFFQEENQRLSQEIVEERQKLSELKNQYDRLKIAKTLSLSDDEKKSAHLRLSALVRNVNECIKLVNNNE